MSQNKAAALFDNWAQNGRDVGMEEGHGDVVRQVVAAMEIAPGEKILDLGCGNGWATRLLAQTNAGVQAIGVDASAQMIARADELHSFTIRARYDLGSFEELDFKDGTFDRAFSMEALYYASDLKQSLAELHRVLKPGGRADIVLDFYKENAATGCWAEKMELEMHFLSEEEWKAAFGQAGFENVECQRVIDSRGPGDPETFQADECTPDWETRLALHAAGSLWIRAQRS